MNKKGFTLIELTISITLLSVVMVFMLNFITLIRKDEDSISLNTDLLLSTSLISENLNKSIKSSGGISSLNCTDILCTINLLNNTTKTIEITNEKTLLKLTDTTNNKIEFTRKLPEDYEFTLSRTENNALYIIEIGINSHPEYNIEIISKKS